MSESSQPPIRLMSHNPIWPQEFEQARSSILQAAEGWVVEIQHVGSTAIEGGIARPVIDLLAGMDDETGLNEAAELIEGLNYARIEMPDWCSDELGAHLQKPRSGEVTHTVLLVRRGGSTWQRAIALREWLVANLYDWQAFQNVKKDHFAPGCNALARYNAAKDAFLSDIEDRMSDV